MNLLDHFHPRALRRFSIIHLLCLLLLAGNVLANPQSDAAPISNGNPDEIAAVNQMLSRLERAVTARDNNALLFYGVQTATPTATVQSQIRTTHIAFAPSGALVRQAYHITQSSRNTEKSAPSVGTHEFWLRRGADGTFSFSDKRWSAPYDAMASLQETAREQWNLIPVASRNTPLLHLVAARRGGRWIALRFSRWTGAVLDSQNLAPLAQSQTIAPGQAFDANWMRTQMNTAPEGKPGNGHFIFQKGPSGWVSLGMAWEADNKFSAESDTAVSRMRREILGTSYSQAPSHRALGIALAQIGLYQESADELEKANALQPGLIPEELLKQVRDSKPNDPENLARTQLEAEGRVGLDPQHPQYVVKQLEQDYRAKPSVLLALRLGLEHSRLGQDQLASERLRIAQDLAERGALRNTTPSDQQWIHVLSEHLEERRELSPIKPTNIIRSSLFTLRCRPNDLAAVQVLAALEAAQHTVYAEYGIPMGSTEVLLWRTQNEFQQYVTRFSAQGHSEFVAALTLTKLIATRQGPVVLGEEINIFTDSRTGVFSTVAHEYGHVATRQLSRGRDVPTWFNEGVATSVEGGYDGYLDRVRRAAETRRILTMNELQQWDVDGERAFLAYSQANSMIDYIAATWGKEAILNILRRIGNDQKPESAFQSVLGISQQELWNRWARDGIK